MFGKIGTTELLLILGIALLIFGPAKLPKLGKAVGQTLGNFKRSANAAEKGESLEKPKKAKKDEPAETAEAAEVVEKKAATETVEAAKSEEA